MVMPIKLVQKQSMNSDGNLYGGFRAHVFFNGTRKPKTETRTLCVSQKKVECHGVN